MAVFQVEELVDAANEAQSGLVVMLNGSGVTTHSHVIAGMAQPHQVWELS